MSSPLRRKVRRSAVPVLAILSLGGFPCFADENHEHKEAGSVAAAPSERIRALESDYQIRRDGSVAFEQRFVLGVAGAAIRRGPVLNYLTAFRGPGGLTLDSEVEILEVRRDGEPEPFRLERRDGFLSLFVGSADRALEHREHRYYVRGRMEADWRRGEGEFAATIDVLGPLPALPIDAAEVEIRLPEGVPVQNFTAAATGAVVDSERRGPPCEALATGNVLQVRTTAPLDENPSFFINLSWPSASFATKSQWPKVLRQHPRLPLSAISAVLLLWALAALLTQAARRRAAGSRA